MECDSCTPPNRSLDQRWQPFWDNVCKTEMGFRVAQYVFESINLSSCVARPLISRSIFWCVNVRYYVASIYFIKYLTEFYQGEMLHREHWLDYTSDVATIIGSLLMPVIFIDDWGLMRLGRFATATGHFVGACDVLSYGCEALSGGVEAMNEKAEGKQVSLESKHKIIDNTLEVSFLIIESYLSPQSPKAIFIIAGLASGGWGLYRVSPFAGSVYNPMHKKRHHHSHQRR